MPLRAGRTRSRASRAGCARRRCPDDVRVRASTDAALHRAGLACDTRGQAAGTTTTSRLGRLLRSSVADLRAQAFSLRFYRLQQLAERAYMIERLCNELALVAVLRDAQVCIPSDRCAIQLTGAHGREAEMVMCIRVQRVETDRARECFGRCPHTSLRRQCAARQQRQLRVVGIAGLELGSQFLRIFELAILQQPVYFVD